MSQIIILYEGAEEWFIYEGSLDEAIQYVKCERRYKNYGRTGARIYAGTLQYEITESAKETRHFRATEYAYA